MERKRQDRERIKKYVSGGVGLDNIVFSSIKKCNPTWVQNECVNCPFTFQFKCFRWIRMPGYELEKEWDQWWRLIPRFYIIKQKVFSVDNFLFRKEEFNMTDISDEDLKSRSNYVEVSVDSVEECARYCSLGSACDTFFIDSDLVCTYLPHVALKSFELVDFVNFTKKEGKDMYLLQCSQGKYLSLWFNIIYSIHFRFWAILCWQFWSFYPGYFKLARYLNIDIQGFLHSLL